MAKSIGECVGNCKPLECEIRALVGCEKCIQGMMQEVRHTQGAMNAAWDGNNVKYDAALTAHNKAWNRLYATKPFGA